jgi:hypothetical protein
VIQDAHPSLRKGLDAIKYFNELDNMDHVRIMKNAIKNEIAQEVTQARMLKKQSGLTIAERAVDLDAEAGVPIFSR